MKRISLVAAAVALLAGAQLHAQGTPATKQDTTKKMSAPAKQAGSAKATKSAAKSEAKPAVAKDTTKKAPAKKGKKSTTAKKDTTKKA